MVQSLIGPPNFIVLDYLEVPKVAKPRPTDRLTEFAIAICHLVNTKCHKKTNLAIRSLKLLARHGIPAPHLLRIYFFFICSTHEYCCPVWHLGLTREQSDRVERVQYCAFLVISKVPKVPYISPLNQFQLQTLQSRRLKLVLSFGNKILSNPIHRNNPPTPTSTGTGKATQGHCRACTETSACDC